MGPPRSRPRGDAPKDEPAAEAASEPEATPKPPPAPPEAAAPKAAPQPEAAPAPKQPEPFKATGLRYRCKHIVGYGSRDYRKGDELPKLSAEDEKRLLKLGAIERILEDA